MIEAIILNYVLQWMNLNNLINNIIQTIVYATMDDNEDLSEEESCWYVELKVVERNILDKYSSV